MQSHKCGVVGKDHLPRPAGYTHLNVELLILELLFCRAASWTVSSHAVLVHDVIPSQMQDFIFDLHEQHCFSPAHKLLPPISGHSQTC